MSKHDVARVLLRTRSVQACRGAKDGFDRGVTRPAGCGRDFRRLGCRRRRSWGGRRRRLLQQPLQHAARLFAAGGAQVELRLRAAGDGRRVGLAQVAALAAVLLRHGREQLARQRPPFGELHALVDRHGGIVPGCPIGAVAAGQRLGRGARQLALEWRHLGIERQHAGKEAVEPGALLHGERRRVGDHEGARGRGVADGHAAPPCASIMDLSASTSCRRANSWNVSAEPARCAR